MRSRRVVFSAAARRDVAEAVAFVARDDAGAAGRLRDRLVSASRRLGEFPDLGRGGVPGGDGSRRTFAVPGTPHRLVYRADAGTVTILRVWHGARQWPPSDES